MVGTPTAEQQSGVQVPPEQRRLRQGGAPHSLRNVPEPLPTSGFWLPGLGKTESVTFGTAVGVDV